MEDMDKEKNMYPEFVQTRKDIIFWEYANLLLGPASSDEKQLHLVTEKFKKFQTELNEWLYVCRKMDDILASKSAKCSYCNSSDELIYDRIVLERSCHEAEIHNIVKTCKSCRISRGNRSLMEWWELERRYELPPNVFGGYLKMLYTCHQCLGLLDKGIRNINREPNLIDLEAVFKAKCEPKRVEYR